MSELVELFIAEKKRIGRSAHYERSMRYAMTSHAAQGLTVDKVFVAGAISQEGLYVSATRGRESIRVFVPDRGEFLRAAGLRSEARMSALEFMRQSNRQIGQHIGFRRRLGRNGTRISNCP